MNDYRGDRVLAWVVGIWLALLAGMFVVVLL
jgi:hypothetical protein